uniref:Amino acid transporter transmembrane domain-containing protein n=1 Tax=Romanomermis culicivorax TaxID=13658 RepID=A0A915LC85_ROMCU
MKEFEILELLEETDPMENKIVPINSSLTHMNLFEIYTDQEFLLHYHFHKETVRNIIDELRILPIENKMRYPEDFTENCGVLPTLMILITVFYTSLGFYGYTAFGDETKGTLPLNMPDNTLFSSVSIMLALMAFLAHPVNLYVVFDMFWPGFKRKFPLKYVFWLDKIQTLDILFRLFWVLLTCKKERISFLFIFYLKELLKVS